MKKLKSLVPMKIKVPIAIIIQEIGKLPTRLVYDHVRRACVEGGVNIPKIGKEKIYSNIKRDTYNYFESMYGNLATEITAHYSSGIRPVNNIVWVFWWQGEELAPDIVKRCIVSMRRNMHNAKICVIDSRNYRDYVSVPNHICEKRENGVLSLTHFSDYYRMALLATHGGLWIDASIFVKSIISDNIFEYPIFSVRNPSEECVNISNWEWTVGVIGGWKENTLFHAAEKLLNQYWKDHDFLVDYYVFDYVIRLVCNYSQGVKNDLDTVAPNNKDFFYYQDHLSDVADQFYECVYGQDTQFYKISWKGNYPTITLNGKQTVYGKWVSENPL